MAKLSKRVKILIALAVTFSILLVFFVVVAQKPTRLVGQAGGGVVSPDNSLLFVTSPVPPKLLADGRQPATIAVFLMDSKTEKEESLGVPNKEVKLTSTLGSISPESQTTDKKGQAVFTITSTEPGEAKVTAVDTTDGITINKTVIVVFTK